MAIVRSTLEDACALAENPIPEMPDFLAPDLDVVFCGINPGLRSAMVGHPFANRTNRFWRVLHLAGFTAKQLEPDEAIHLLDYGCGLTSAVKKPTTAASELKRADFVAARPAFEEKILHYRPRHLAFLGKPAVSIFLNVRELDWGRQTASFGGATVWVLPNTSGLNCAFTLDVLTDAYRELYLASRR